MPVIDKKAGLKLNEIRKLEFSLHSRGGFWRIWLPLFGRGSRGGSMSRSPTS